jgi:hypothetical protein
MIPRSKAGSVQSRAAALVGEWQQRGPETFSGHVVRKLRLTIVPPQSMAAANAVG